MINTHTHTKYSSDGVDSIDRICEFAILKTLKGVAFTDHACICNFVKTDNFNRLINCKNDVSLAKETYGDKLKILFGIEISERFINPTLSDSLLKIDDLDVIICSLHDDLPIENLGFNSGLKLNDFKKFTLSQIKGVLDIYYDILNKTAKDSDYDILAHITYPFRYINCRDKVNFDVTLVLDKIIDILKIIINRNKALELNTSMADEDFFMPSFEILKIYRDLGGKWSR